MHLMMFQLSYYWHYKIIKIYSFWKMAVLMKWYINTQWTLGHYSKGKSRNKQYI